MVMTSLTKRLAGKGTGQAMEYKEESVHSALTIAPNAIVFIVKKVEDSTLWVMTMPVIAPKLADCCTAKPSS